MQSRRSSGEVQFLNWASFRWRVFIVGVVLVFSSQVQAQYAPNFDTFTPKFSLSGQQGWVTNDTNQANLIGYIPGYSESRTSYWAVLGGVVQTAPSTTSVDLYRAFTLPDNGSAATFSVNFAISSSATPYTNKDSFSWKFRTADGTPIVSLDFEPFDPTTLKIYWTTYDGTKSSTTYGIGYDAIYVLNATVTGLGTASPHFRVGLTDGDGAISTPINTTLPANTPTGIGEVAAGWKLVAATPAGFGANSLLFQNYSVVPEPSAIALLGLSGLTFLAARLRRKTA